MQKTKRTKAQTPTFCKKDSENEKKHNEPRNHHNAHFEWQNRKKNINNDVSNKENICSVVQVDPDCDFSDDMIDQHVAVSVVPVMMSPRENSIGSSQIDSLCRALRSIDNIQNVYKNGNQLNQKKQENVNCQKLTTQSAIIKTFTNITPSCPLQHNKPNVVSSNPPTNISPPPSCFQTSKFKSNSGGQNSRLQKNITEHLLRKQKKLKELKEQLQENEMKECTFTPKCHQKGNNEKSKGNLDQFLKKQQEHISKIQKKKEDIRKKNEEIKKMEQSFKPKINKHCEADNYRNKKPAHQRLYQLKPTNSKTQNDPQYFQTTQKKSLSPTPSFQSKQNKVPSQSSQIKKPLKMQIKQKNTSNCSQYLYEDAERRQNMLKSMEKNKQNVKQIPKLKNKTSQRYIEKKFIKEYCYVLECLGLLPGGEDYTSTREQQRQCFNSNQQEVEDEKFQVQNLMNIQGYTKFKGSSKSEENNAIRYNSQIDDINGIQFSVQQFNDILRGLGFLVYGDQCLTQMAAQQRNLSFEAFQILQQYGVNIRNVCVFLLAVVGIFDTHSIEFYDSAPISDRKKQFTLTQKQGRKLHKYFDLLYRNRLSSARPNLKPRSHQPQHHSPYQSRSHTEHTNNLASKYRSKMIERANQTFISNNIDIVLPTQNMLAHQDLLVIDSLGRNLQMKKLREDKKCFVDQQCTFHPKVNGHGYGGAFTDRGAQKCRELYQHAKSRHEMQKHHLSTYDHRSPDNRDHGLSQFSQISRQTIDNQKKNYKQNQKKMKDQVTPSKKSTQQFQKGSQKKQQSCLNVKDVDKAVARMTLGRKQRQLKNKLLERGEPDLSKKRVDSKSPSKLSQFQHPNPSTKRTFYQFSEHEINEFTYQPQAILTNPNPDLFPHKTPLFSHKPPNPPTLPSYPQFGQQRSSNFCSGDQPFLVIDINMGQQLDQIQFYSGDEKRVGQIVDEFCIDHDLDDECKEQLLQLVEIQMVRYLNSIGDSTQD